MYKHREMQDTEFATFLRSLRERLNLTQTTVADALGISIPRVSDMERGLADPKANTIIDMKRTLLDLFMRCGKNIESRGEKFIMVDVVKDKKGAVVFGLTIVDENENKMNFSFSKKADVQELIDELRNQAKFMEKHLRQFDEIQKPGKTKPGKIRKESK